MCIRGIIFIAKKKEENSERNVRYLYDFQLSRLIIKL